MSFPADAQYTDPQPPAKSNRTMIIVVIVLVVLCCCCLVGGGVGTYLWNNGDELFGTSTLLPLLAAI